MKKIKESKPIQNIDPESEIPEFPVIKGMAKQPESDQELDNWMKNLSESIAKNLKMQEDEKQKAAELEQTTLPKIESIKAKIKELVEQKLNPTFQQGGKSVMVVSNNPPYSLPNQENFIELLFYPKGQDKDTRGIHTAVLRFVFEPRQGKVRVRKRPTFVPIALEESKQPIILNQDSLKNMTQEVMTFATEFAERS